MAVTSRRKLAIHMAHRAGGADNPVLATILQVASERHAPYKQIKAAVETGLVESELRNLGYGEGSSVGWRQETKQSYPSVNRMNVRASVNRFFDEAAQHDRPGLSSGQLAQAVQRSAFPGRYADRSGEAASLVGKGGAAGDGQWSVDVGHKTAFDTAGFEQARKLSVVGQLLARHHGTGGVLFRSGVLSTEAPDPAEFTRQALTSRLVKGGASGAGRRNTSVTGAGVATFEGKPVAAWIKPELEYARRHGWKGTVTSGLRSFAEQTRIYNSGVRPAAKPGTSNHEGTDFPRGAVDVSDAETLARILRRKGSPLVWAGGKDPVHFSHPHGGSY